MKPKLPFIVTFSRIGSRVKNYRWYAEAPSVAELEAPIKAFVDEVLSDDVTVAIIPENMNGSLNYGLLGNFTIEG